MAVGTGCMFTVRRMGYVELWISWITPAPVWKSHGRSGHKPTGLHPYGPHLSHTSATVGVTHKAPQRC